MESKQLGEGEVSSPAPHHHGGAFSARVTRALRRHALKTYVDIPAPQEAGNELPTTLEDIAGLPTLKRLPAVSPALSEVAESGAHTRGAASTPDRRPRHGLLLLRQLDARVRRLAQSFDDRAQRSRGTHARTGAARSVLVAADPLDDVATGVE